MEGVMEAPMAVQSFTDALTEEYVDGVAGAVGKWRASSDSTVGIDVDELELRVQKAWNRSTEIAKVRAELLGETAPPSLKRAQTEGGSSPTSHAWRSNQENCVLELQRQVQSTSGDLTELRNDLRSLQDQCQERLHTTKEQLAATLQDHMWQQQQTTDKMYEVVHDLCGCLQTELKKVKDDVSKSGEAMAQDIQSLQAALKEEERERREADVRSEQCLGSLQRRLEGAASNLPEQNGSDESRLAMGATAASSSGDASFSFVADVDGQASDSEAAFAQVAPRLLQKGVDIEAVVDLLERLTTLAAGTVNLAEPHANGGAAEVINNGTKGLSQILDCDAQIRRLIEERLSSQFSVEAQERRVERESLQRLIEDMDMQARVHRQEINGLFRDLRSDWEGEVLRIWEALDTHTHEVNVAAEEYGRTGSQREEPQKAPGPSPRRPPPSAGSHSSNTSANSSPSMAKAARPIAPGAGGAMAAALNEVVKARQGAPPPQRTMPIPRDQREQFLPRGRVSMQRRDRNVYRRG